MARWVWILVLGEAAAASNDEDGCNLQKLDHVAAGALDRRAAAPDAASVLASFGSIPANGGSKEALLETEQQFVSLEALLRHKKPEPKLTPAPAQGDVGHVGAVYTFAAPPLTRWHQVLNGRQADGVFPGLRVWTKAPDGKFDLVSRASFWFRHPKITSFEIIVGDAIGSITVGNFTTPLYDGLPNKTDPTVSDTSFLPRDGASPCTKTYSKCHGDYYWQNYSKMGEPELDLFYNFSMDAYEEWPLKLMKRNAKPQGYRMIGRALIPPMEAFSYEVHNDIVHLWQHESSLECVLAWEGTDATSVNDWIANLRNSMSNYCGFHTGHRGFGDKLRHQTTSLVWSLNIEAKLQSCANVTVTGHSQGAALAELFAGCVNRAMLPDTALGRSDYAAAIWTPSPSRLLDEVECEFDCER